MKRYGKKLYDWFYFFIITPKEKVNKANIDKRDYTIYKVLHIKANNQWVKNTTCALAGVAQWTECWPANQRVAGSIPSQGTCLNCGPGPQ